MTEEQGRVLPVGGPPVVYPPCELRTTTDHLKNAMERLNLYRESTY